MKKYNIYLSPPHIGESEIKYIKEALDSNWIAPLGPNVDAFEREICDYTGVKSGLALSSGTAGIHLVLRYLGVEQGDYVFCSTLTFAGSCFPILYEKAIPVFIDSEEFSWNMSPLLLEEALDIAKKNNKLPKAVIIVDLYGQSADYGKLLPICESYKIPVIEDSAEALGATYGDKKCGALGYINILSFNGNKIVTTSGGGMALSEDEDALKKMRFWATQSRENERHYEHKELGYNYRMSNVCAGIGRGQLETLEERISKKKYIFEFYKRELDNIDDIDIMPVANWGQPNYWLTCITINGKKSPFGIMDALEKESIECRPVWKPMHLQKLFNKYDFIGNGTSEKIFNKGICLPCDTRMTDTDLYKITSIIKKSIE